MHDFLQLENMSDSWAFWCLQALRDYELGNQLWSVQATISAKLAMSVNETFIHAAKSYKIIGSMRAQRSVMKQRLKGYGL